MRRCGRRCGNGRTRLRHDIPLGRPRADRRKAATWPYRFCEHHLRAAAGGAAAMAYRHANPVRDGYVGGPRDWPFSTVQRWEPATAPGKTSQVGLQPDGVG